MSVRDVEAAIATVDRHKYVIAGVVKAIYDVPPKDRATVLAAILHSIKQLGLTTDQP